MVLMQQPPRWQDSRAKCGICGVKWKDTTDDFPYESERYHRKVCASCWKYVCRENPAIAEDSLAVLDPNAPKPAA